ncbi:ABC transporter substrate-binding protein [Dehalococcoides mccartyi]|jgi:branched-chain amino acid transport system substrate-binding protein|uniref:ABC transporter substrate-binding protein n=1 Tax=Dehalococcoides mccartyi TaxID=61435 RepID=UPI00006ADDA0|nr:ABC transporter substrate-binding protein [Dehalococcoides mccartyi]AGG07926.1 hydrophobic amino acid uptake transporter (HAAT) family, periplasmic substrate binding protein [Dehalococcoides mccartyi BTF08]AQW62476.1 ABC transporter [Dehalococcoides mccartyi]AQX73276.1 ABC transporter [Dehalococcoides mccartyi]AQX74674.1 ABC transporter [Dehalococcoides mccartyi]AQY73251.1 ABC transporter [Dehalococcoides mccartyi]
MRLGKSEIGFRIFMALVLTLVPVVLSGCNLDNITGNNNNDPLVTNRTLKVGLSVCYTGPAAEKGTPQGNAKLDAIKYINDELGGVNGYKIEPIFRDTKYDTAIAVTVINEFISSECLFFTTNSSKDMQASMEIANRAGFPGFTTFSSPSLTHPPQHIYSQLPDYGDDWVAFMKYYMENIWQGEGKPKVALMILQNPTGYGARDAATAMAAELGVEIVGIYEHSTTINDDTANLLNMKNQNPDIVYISSTPQPTSVIVRQMIELGIYPGVQIGCGHGGFTQSLVELLGADKAEGILGVYPTVSWDENVPAMAKMKEYCLKYHPENYGNMDYIVSWSEGLIIAEILRLAIENSPGGVNSLTPQIIEEFGIKRLNGYDVGGLHGPVSYSVGDNRLVKSVRVFKIEDGQLKVISGWIETPSIAYENFDWFGK